MWPKMLFEMLPHIGRLVPMAERYFESRKVREQQEETALSTLTQTLDTGLTRLAHAQQELQQTVEQQGAQSAALAADLKQVRLATESMQTRLAGFEQEINAAEAAAARAGQAASRMRLLFAIIVLLLLVLTGLVIAVLVRLGGR